jgi:glycosyltransferase involved in cell wall biosynthesis
MPLVSRHHGDNGSRHIVHIVADGTPGGGTTFVLALVEALIKRRSPGAKVSVIGQSGSYLLERAKALGANTFGADFFRARVDPRIPLRLGQILQSIAPEFVHVHSGRAAFSLSFVPLRRRWPLLYTVHGYHFCQKPIVSRILGAVAERWISLRVDKTIFVSESDRRIAEKWHLVPSKATSGVIRNAIDPRVIPRALETQSRLVAFSGRLNFQKDPLFFVEIARELASEGYRFVMMGSGEMELEVRQKIAAYGLNSVLQLHTGLSRESAFELLRRASVCVITSRWEGLPLLPLETMVMGVPVVAPRLECMAEIVDSGVNGFLESERTPQAFARTIRKLTSDPGLHTSVVQAARDRVLEEFSYDRLLVSYWDLYGLNRSSRHLGGGSVASVEQ